MNSKIIRLIIFILLSVYPIEVDATENLKRNNRKLNLRLQYAGNLGLISYGIGFYDSKKRLNIHTIYGYLPECINGTKVHTFGIKPLYRVATTGISDKTDINYYSGITLFYAMTKNTYIIYPDYFSKGYYKSNALRSSLLIGSKLNYIINNPKISTVSVFVEIGMPGNEIGNAVLTRHIDLIDIVDFSCGVAFKFR